MRRLGIVALLFLVGCQSAQPEKDVPLHYDIGAIHKEVTTLSSEAQLWFDRGLGLAYGFNHEEAIVCFERAAEADPDCAMCYWGKAYALGPNYNNLEMTGESSQAAYEAVQQAAERMAHASDVEQALIGALQTRYAWPAPEDRTELEQAYAAAMREVRAAHPDDPDVAALTGEAVMMLRPWKLWSHDVAFEHLRQAAAIDEKLNYDEPWGWMEPARHALGALLTEQGRYEEAVAVYEANLARYPENGWALHGLAESLRGLGRSEEAEAAQARFRTAWDDADIVIPGSCFCRTKT